MEDNVRALVKTKQIWEEETPIEFIEAQKGKLGRYFCSYYNIYVTL